MLENEKLSAPCPSCGAENMVTVADVRKEVTITCSGCGRSIDVKDGGLGAGIDKAVADAKATFANISKTFGKKR